MLPITGSGLGVVDAVLVSMLVELSAAPDDPLVAATVLWRFPYSVIILPLGAITMAVTAARTDLLRLGGVPSERA